MGHSNVSKDNINLKEKLLDLLVLFSTHIIDNQKQHWREISEREQKN